MNEQKITRGRQTDKHNNCSGDKISVIIPVYNVEKYIGRCLDSILENDYQNLEIICINDGSTDNGLNVLLKYAYTDNRIIVISTCNGGVSRARNIGLEICTGEYVAFIDADDCIHHQYFSILYRLINSQSAGIALCMWERFSEEYQSLPINTRKLDSKQYSMKKILSTDLCQNCWARLYKRSIISNIRFPLELVSGEDGFFNREVMWNNREKSAVATDFPLYFYFQRKNSVTHTYGFFLSRRGTIKCFIKKGDKCCNRIDKEFWIRTAIEIAFGYRYHAYSQKKYEDIKIAKDFLKCSMRIMKKYKLFSQKTRVRYLIQYFSPKIYKKINKLN